MISKNIYVQDAIDFATDAHEGQVRKYTGEPYVTHPIAVAILVSTVHHTRVMLCAALLHDTIEDTSVTAEEIEKHFGHEVAELVVWLTNTTNPSDGNRATRKEIERQRMRNAPNAAKTIKVADIIHNCLSIKEEDTNFWRTYRDEKIAAMDILKFGANSKLVDIAWRVLKED